MRYGRVRISPGKFGPKDLRVEFCSRDGCCEVPTLAELVVMLAAAFIAEDRYDLPGQSGRWMLFGIIRFVAKNVRDLQGPAMREALRRASKTSSLTSTGQAPEL